MTLALRFSNAFWWLWKSSTEAEQRTAALDRKRPAVVLLSRVHLPLQLGFLAVFVPALVWSQGTYTTNFPLTENPISEGGKWVSGGSVGSSDVKTTGGVAGGVGPAVNNDPVAIRTGTWGPNQTVQATVYSVGASDSYYQEVELHVHMTFAAGPNIRGYEINFRTPNNSSAYVQIVRSDGTSGWAYVGSGCTYPTICGRVAGIGVSNGDVVKATIVGSTISAYINGKLIAQATDSTYKSGAPGIGFDWKCDSTYNAFGFTQFSASDRAALLAQLLDDRRDSSAAISRGFSYGQITISYRSIRQLQRR